MVLIVESGTLDYKPVSTIVVQTLLAAFTFLSSLSIRDSVTQMIAAITPGDTSKKIFFTLMITFIFLFLTVFMAYYFQDKLNN